MLMRSEITGLPRLGLRRGAGTGPQTRLALHSLKIEHQRFQAGEGLPATPLGVVVITVVLWMRPRDKLMTSPEQAGICGNILFGPLSIPPVGHIVNPPLSTPIVCGAPSSTQLTAQT